MPLIPFGKLNGGVVSQLERVQTQSTTLNSTIIPRCRKSDAYYAYPAVPARHVTLYDTTMQYNFFRKRSRCVQVLPPVDGSKIYIYNDHHHGRPAGRVPHPSRRFNAQRTKSLVLSTCTLVLIYSLILYEVGVQCLTLHMRESLRLADQSGKHSPARRQGIKFVIHRGEGGGTETTVVFHPHLVLRI